MAIAAGRSNGSSASRTCRENCVKPEAMVPCSNSRHLLSLIVSSAISLERHCKKEILESISQCVFASNDCSELVLAGPPAILFPGEALNS